MSIMNITPFSSVKEIRNLLDSRQLSATELLDFTLKRFEAFDGRLGSALELFDAESILNVSQGIGPLAGIPGLIKDNICQKDRTLSCASKVLQHFRATYDATAIARLKNSGALLVGRANMDEFAMGSSTETSAYKKTHNPWDTSRVPGGSSGGSAAAVAAGLVPWALGSETGGSVRQPASLCGIVGIKPTYGLVSRYGLVAYASSLDQIGVFSRTVYDNALVLSVIAGHDAHDATTRAVSPQDYTTDLQPTLPKGLRIGVVQDAIHASGMDAEVTAAIEQAVVDMAKLGARVVPVSLPTLDYAAAAYFVVSRAEAASNLSRFDGVRYGLRNAQAQSLVDMYSSTRHDGFGPEVKARIIVGNYVLSTGHASEFYQNAKKVQRLIRKEFIDTFKDVDVLIMPTNPAPAFKLGAYDTDKLQIDLQDYFTCSVNLAGIPALSIPCGQTKERLPIGFQLIGPHLSESLLYRVAYAYEQNTAWHSLHPQGF
jgi:aspartyl-tRNA(Asn)/glutamyl-tRNA(Gln) amidotransferase subunit A